MPANYVLLGRQTLSQSVASVEFTNIPQSGYTDLKIVVSARNDAATTVGGLWLRFNGTSTNLSSRNLFGTGSAASSFSDTTIFAYSNAASATASTFSNVEYYIPNYTSSNNKSVSVDSVMENNATAASSSLGAGLWSNTAAITSIQILTFNNSNSAAANFVANSTFSLYGIAAVGTTPVIAPKATGGDVIVNDGTYWYHAFRSTGTFVPQTGLSCDVLVIAGGGGGTRFDGIATTNGVNSNITGGSLSLTAAVGGGRGGYQYVGGNGGSGGGGASQGNVYSGGTGTAGQGNNGGNSWNQVGGGGGGAGSAGTTASSGVRPDGGAGVNTYSSWASATNTGVSGFYAGGGGGGITGGSAGLGGSGGGGTGGTSGANGIAGIANTGGGAGGGSNGGNSYGGGGGGAGGLVYSPAQSFITASHTVTVGAGGTGNSSGGSGIVIIRYLMA